MPRGCQFFENLARAAALSGLVLFACSRPGDRVGNVGEAVEADAARPTSLPGEAPASPNAARDPSSPGVPPGSPEVGPEAVEPQALSDAHIDWEANPVMQRLGHVAATLTLSEYSHGLSVDERKGIYKFDCSGMVYWLLKRAAPRAASALAYELEHRPLARDIYRRIAATEPGKPRHGWQRVARVDELQPGDVVAWLKPSIIRSPNTGHTGFVVLPPYRVPEYDNAYLVRIADATSLLHDDDTRIGRDGFGLGTILLVSDPESGEPIAYGWSGLRWRAFETDIALGRATQ